MRLWGTKAGLTALHFGAGLAGATDSLLAGYSKRRAPLYTWPVILDRPAYHRAAA